MSSAEATKLDILLDLRKNGYNLIDGDKPEIMTMPLGGGYTLECNVKKPATEWKIFFNDGVETTEYAANSEKVVYTHRKDSDKLIEAYDAALRSLLDSDVVVDTAPAEPNIKPPESKHKTQWVKPSEKKDKHTQTPTAIIPVDVRSKQIVELTSSDIIEYLCPKASEKEAMIFLKVCQARGINPFLKEAYLVKYKSEDPASIVVAKDYFARKAEEHPMYDGEESGIILIDKDGNLERREGAFMLPNENLAGGWCKVYRKDRTRPILTEVAFHEYVQKTREGAPNKFWSKMSATMIQKVAFSQCHRKAFPGEFSGLYDSSEIEGSMEGLEDSVIEANYEEVDA